MSAENEKSFFCEPGFCSNCGTILPLIADINAIKCNICNTLYGPEAYGDMECQYVINFHTPDDYLKNAVGVGESADGPVVARNCPQCGHNKMSYATMQLRSADEGQTIFYTCVKCKYKESENS